VCRAQVNGSRLCPRCQSDVTVWEQEDLSLLTFVLEHGGILGLFPAVVVWLVWLFFFLLRGGWTLYDQVVAAIASALSAMTFLMLFSLRLEWREKRWIAQISRERPPQLLAAQIFTALAGILLPALCAVLYSLWPQPWTPLQKLGFGVVYVPSYVLLTIVIILSIVVSYMDALDRRVPQPLFMDTRRLLMVVMGAVRDINLLGHQQHSRRRPRIVLGGDPGEETPFYEIVEAVRLREDGGVRVLIHEWLPTHHARGQSNETMSDYAEMYWHVKSDRWGRIESMQPESLETYRAGGRAVRMMGRG